MLEQSFKPAQTLPQPQIGRIAQRHHTVARLVALGESTAAISQATGYSMPYICALQKDPAFRGLLEGWQKQVKLGFDGMALKIRDAAGGAVDEFNRRLEVAPTEVSTRDLLKGAEVFLDRAGFGPSATITVNDLRGDVVRDLKTAEAEEGVLIDHQKSTLSQSALQGDGAHEQIETTRCEEEGDTVREPCGEAAKALPAPEL